ncbi:helicase-like transcription factor isoform X2 [Megalops cyprinoides]|nr:helicase-like transcription factor isoform X2 [Megalops cyprinoides]
MQFPSFRRFGGGLELSSIDFFGTDQTETLSQAIRRSAEDTTASVEDEPEANVLFGTIQGSVVGLRYYTGVVNKGEMVSLVREPHNPHDRNAVMVANVYGSQVGHIKRQLAAPMAHIIDNNLARVEGVVPYGVNNAFTMPVHLSFWGKEENREAVMSELNRHGFKLGLGSKGGGQVAAPGRTIDQFFAPLKKVTAIPLTPEQLKNAFDKLFDDLMEDKAREMEAGEAVSTPLLPHQKQALAWMTARENSTDLPPFWVEKNGLYFNVLTNFAIQERPESVRGGILADDMGLGKTLTTIALILTNFHNGNPMSLESTPLFPENMATKRKKTAPKENRAKGIDEAVTEESPTTSHSKRQHEDSVPIIVIDSDDEDDSAAPKKKAKTKGKTTKDSSGTKKSAMVMKEDMGFAAALGGSVAEGSSHKKKAQKKSPGLSKSSSKPGASGGARATLIVCPLSVLSNWLDQFEQHVHADAKLSVYLYYGTERKRESRFLARQDVVLTTYNVLSSDYGNKKSSPLHDVTWLRVVLDEGHIIRNPNALQSKAVLDLTAERRWILSGTPIQNSLKDLWMLISFLKMKPFDVREWWNRVIERPVTLGDSKGLKDLQTLVKGITLRRTKASKVGGRAVVQLPERRVFVQHVTLSEEERREYEAVKREGRDIIGRYFREGTVLTNYADVLAILVRLRQFCCHPHLLRGSTSAAGTTDTSTPSELRERLIKKITLVLGSGSDEECAVCLESLRQPVITYCAHVYCKACICEVIRSEQQNAKCPLCRAQIKIQELVEYPGEDEDSDSSDTKDKWLSSSKVDALMSNLLRLRQEDKSIKSVVVSQFTKFLSLLEIPLKEHGFSFTRLDGSMSQRNRTKALQAFQDSAQGSPSIMLLSLKAGGVGLNLTAASRVFLMDPAWNPAAEDQCVDRCHRLGQKKDVVITKFIVKNSVEENMVKIQRKKQKLVEKAFGGRKVQERKQARIEEIRALMEL